MSEKSPQNKEEPNLHSASSHAQAAFLLLGIHVDHFYTDYIQFKKHICHLEKELIMLKALMLLCGVIASMLD